jgi:hypothetical protein
MYIFTYVHIYLCTYLPMYIFTYVDIYLCTYLPMYIKSTCKLNAEVEGVKAFTVHYVELYLVSIASVKLSYLPMYIPLYMQLDSLSNCMRLICILSTCMYVVELHVVELYTGCRTTNIQSNYTHYVELHTHIGRPYAVKLHATWKIDPAFLQLMLQNCPLSPVHGKRGQLRVEGPADVVGQL